MRKELPPIENVKALINKADWYYWAADDGRAFRDGQASVDAACNALYALSEAEQWEVMKSYPESAWVGDLAERLERLRAKFAAVGIEQLEPATYAEAA